MINQLTTQVIPHVKKQIKSERHHLHWLEANAYKIALDQEEAHKMIKKSKKMVKYLTRRLEMYLEFTVT